MKVMSYNTLFGGFDGHDARRFDAQMKLINEVQPDILLAQELKGYTENGKKRLFKMEERINMRGFIAPAPHTGQNTGVFIKPNLKPSSMEIDSEHFHHAVVIATLTIPGSAKPWTVISAHLCPFGSHVRLREAAYLINHADDNAFTLVAGDFNSVSPYDTDPAGIDELPSRFRARYVTPDGTTDTSILKTLYQAGFVDIAYKLGKHNDPTVPTDGFKGAEFVPFRSDYIIATNALAKLAIAYSVIKSPATDMASDHYPIVAEFNV
jgi:endonuclease/exonuclease/phosphatase family metal-dependent hydrolase